MSLRIGELQAVLDVNATRWERGLDRAQVRMAGLQRDTDGRLRDMRGRFVDAGSASGRGFARRMLSNLSSSMSSGLQGAMHSGMQGLQGLQSAMSSNPYVAAAGYGLASTLVAAALPAIGAALSTAVISVGGLAVIGVGWALLKDEPEVKKAATHLKKTAGGILKDAAQPMKDAFVDAFGSLEKTAKKTKPYVDRIFAAAAKFVQPLVDGFNDLVMNALPGFTSMIEDAGPTFQGIKELMGDVGKGLSGFFKEIGKSAPDTKIFLEDLGKALMYTFIAAGWVIGKLARLYHYIHEFVAVSIQGFQWLYDVLVGHSIIPDLINAIVRWFLSLPTKILGGLISFVSSVIGWFGHMASRGIAAASHMVSSAVHWIAGLPGKAARAMGSLGSRVASVAYSAASRLIGAVSHGISRAVSVVRGLPGRAASALGGIGSRLYRSGAALVSGFVSGIRSMIGRVRDAASSVVSAARRFFPFSPALEGPFSGRGWTLYSGRSLIDGFQQGIAGQLPALRAQLGAMPGVPAIAGAGPAVTPGRPQPVPVVLRVQGDNEDLVKLIKGWVRTQGGGDVNSLRG